MSERYRNGGGVYNTDLVPVWIGISAPLVVTARFFGDEHFGNVTAV
jgi:hypothetical protein